MINMILRVPSIITIGIPIRIMHKGTARTIYSRIESWKFSEAFPFSFIHVDSSRLDNQHIIGPIIPPNGNRKPAKAAR